MLPSYLQSFNFKLRNNFLPVNILYREFLLDNDSCCYFCHVAPESIYHIFGTCEKIQVLWDVASETVKSLCNINVDFRYLRNNLKMDFVDVNIGKNEDIVKVLIYLNSVIHFSIWTILYRSEFCTKKIIEKVVV